MRESGSWKHTLHFERKRGFVCGNTQILPFLVHLARLGDLRGQVGSGCTPRWKF
jgi:hypothetical protein